MYKRQDDTLEYEEIPDLIEFFNPVYRAAAEQVEDGLKGSYELARKMREDGKEYRQQAKGLEAEGDQIYSAQYKAMARSLDSAASVMEKTLDKQAKRLDQNTLAPVRYQLSSAVQSLMIGYQQMEVNKEMLEKMVELYTHCLLYTSSINQIIQNADISRGSFYTYFEDKRDLLQYVFSDILMQAHEFCRESLIRNEGNYWKMLDELFLDWFQFKWSENLMELARIVLFQTETEQLIQCDELEMMGGSPEGGEWLLSLIHI